ncbi:MAG: LysR substrate-binding domain-containing protein [Pseudomonadota bacterium]
MSDANRSLQLHCDLISLRALVAIADGGSFSSAARRIGRSQSAVSLQIAKLEERLQTRLLERSSREVAPTAAGEALIAYARRILALADEAALAVSGQGAAGALRIGIAEYLAPQHFPDLLARFRRAHPQVRLELKLGGGAGLRQTLDQGELDLLIAGIDAGPDGRLLRREPLVWIAGADAPPLQEAEPVPLVCMEAPCSYRRLALEALNAAARSWRIVTDANALSGVTSAVRAGLGVSALARSAVPEEGVRLLSDGLPSLPLTATLAYLPEGAAPLAERFLAFLEEDLAA